MKKLLKYLEGIVPFFVAEGIQYGAAIIFTLLYSIITVVNAGVRMGKAGTTDQEDFSIAIEESLSQEALYLISVIGILICGIVFYFWFRNLIRGEIRGNLRNLVHVKIILLFILLGIGCQFFVTGFMSLIQPLFDEIFSDYAETIDHIMSGSEIVVLLFMVLIAPITEELIFRGVILHKSNKAIPFVGANLLQALLFGIYHWNIVQGIYATIIGFLLGLMYYKFRSIFAPILLHVIINASSFLVMISPSNSSSYIIIMIGGGALVVIALSIIKPLKLAVNQL